VSGAAFDKKQFLANARPSSTFLNETALDNRALAPVAVKNLK
jgi:hypothetical protein